MKLGTGIALVIGFSFALTVTSKHAKPDFEWRKIGESNREERKGKERSVAETRPEERELITLAKLDAYNDNNDKSNNKLNFGMTALDTTAALFNIDYTQSGGEIAWEVANAVVPMIGAALAFIPGVGPIISGLFLGIWSIASSIFGPKQENPMEKMVKEMAEQLRKQVDTKLSNIITRAIYGEIARNNYICNKYNYVNQSMASKFEKNNTLSEIDANTLMMYVNDCDNFLKDTSEAFVYDEYADVLWIPSAITTMVRLGFLAELIKTGPLMRLQPKIIAAYFQELKNDTRRQLTFFSKGMDNIQTRLKDEKTKNHEEIKTVSLSEMAACKLQNQFLYFDPVLYPYGKPTVIDKADMLDHIYMMDYYKETEFNNLKVKHLQIFFNRSDTRFAFELPARQDGYLLSLYDFSLNFLNCIIGPTYLESPKTYWFKFHTFPGNKLYSYEFRLMYLEFSDIFDLEPWVTLVPILSNIDKNSKIFKDYEQVNRNFDDHNIEIRTTCLMIEFVHSNHSRANESKILVDVPASVRTTKCSYKGNDTFCDFFYGDQFHIRASRFKIQYVGTFNHNNDETLNPLILIEAPLAYLRSPHTLLLTGYNVGLEIILRPYYEL